MIGFRTKRRSRWLAPIVGAIVVAAMVVRMAKRPDVIGREHLPIALTVGAVVGFCTGLLVLVLDPTPTKLDAGSEEQPTAPDHAQGTLVSRFLAIACVALFITGPVALCLSIVAILANRKVAGWPRIASWTGLVLSLPMTILMVLAVFLA